jgi:two-component system response regulator AtoC
MDSSNVSIALIDDDITTAQRLEEGLIALGYPVDVFADGEPFLDRFLLSPYDLVITDLKLRGMSGLEILRRVKSKREETEVVVITGFGSVDTAVDAIRSGAFHYLTKPIRLYEFQNLIKRIIEKIILRNEARNLRASIPRGAGLGDIIGCSPEMNKIFRMVEKVVPLSCPILIQGESGTGKELLAKAIHQLNPHRKGPMVSFNCGGFSNELLANELFGHERGSFTGAHRAKKGLLEAADHGTVLLDEIGEMPLDMQVKLLRVLQEKQIYRIGSTKPISLDIRVLAASNKNIREEVEKGRFREDLFFRLNVVTISLPRLVEREGDLPLLMNHFLRRAARMYQKEVSGFSQEVKEALEKYHFPGNIRELKNITARAVILSEGPEIQLDDLPQSLRKGFSPDTVEIKTLEDLEKDYLRRVLAKKQHNRTEAAKVLGITRSTLWRKIKKYGLE